MIDLQQARRRIEQHVVEQESRDGFAEVHTPFELIEDMLDKGYDDEFWRDPTNTVLDSCAGIGNFGVVVMERFMKGLGDEIPDENERYQHIVENQLFQNELQPKNVLYIKRLFDPEFELELNLKCTDFLELDVLNTRKEDWKTELFRSHYSTARDFIEFETPDDELERLKRGLELCETEAERQWMARGYEDI